MATSPTPGGITYREMLERIPEDNRRIELVDGEIVMAPAPTLRHQEVVGEIFVVVRRYAREHGGRAFGNPVDVYVSETNVLQPDVAYLAPGDLDPDEERVVKRASLVVEVSSPSTRRRDLGRKMELYAELGVPEYWFVDLDARRIEVRLLEGATYAAPRLFEGLLASPTLPGLEVSVPDVLA
jgi:Uma2 family endonuclease